MRKIEAEQLIGKQVRVWTAANGVYVGTLEVVSGSPWRGMVSITGVVEPAHHFDHGTICRRGFRPGEVLEAGGACIKETTESGHPTRTDSQGAATMLGAIGPGAATQCLQLRSSTSGCRPTSARYWALIGSFAAVGGLVAGELQATGLRPPLSACGLSPYGCDA